MAPGEGKMEGLSPHLQVLESKRPKGTSPPGPHLKLGLLIEYSSLYDLFTFCYFSFSVQSEVTVHNKDYRLFLFFSRELQVLTFGSAT